MGHSLEIAIRWPWAGQHISLLRGKYSSALTVPFDLLTFKCGGVEKRPSKDLRNLAKVNYSEVSCFSLYKRFFIS